jgi:hypothetical protein
MSTKNFEVTTDWLLIANAADDDVLVSSGRRAIIEFAVMDAEEDPEVSGHQLTRMAEGEAITRSALGPGYLYARVFDPRFSQSTLVVSGSTVGDD